MFETTYRIDTWSWDGSKSVHHITIGCRGNGTNHCPSAIISDGGEGGNYDSFIESSTEIMVDYVYNQVSSGVYNGHANFDIEYNGELFYRNVSWEGDATQGIVEMNIVPTQY